MSTLVVYGKGITTSQVLANLVLSPTYYDRASFIVKPLKWYHLTLRCEARFHNLTAFEIASLQVRLSFQSGISKIELI